MRIQSQHVFYLDFRLPVFGGVHEDGLGIEFRDQRAIIVPWSRRDPLFYGELGQNLKAAEFSIRPTDVADGQLTKRVIDVTIDRLIVAIDWDHEGGPANNSDKIQTRLEEAVTYANFFIGHLRSITGSADLRRIEAYWHPDDLTFSVHVPYTIQWSNRDTGALLPIFDGMNGFHSAGGIRLPFNGVVEWSAVENSMATGTLPPFYLSLLVDAREALMVASVREAILCVASACEARVNTYLEEQTILSKTKANEIVRSRPDQHSFAVRYFDLLPKATCGQSLSAFNAEIFSDVESCYQQRNRIMHSGDFLDPLNDMPVTDRLRVVSQWMFSAGKALAWIDCLPT